MVTIQAEGKRNYDKQIQSQASLCHVDLENRYTHQWKSNLAKEFVGFAVTSCARDFDKEETATRHAKMHPDMSQEGVETDDLLRSLARKATSTPP